MSHLTRGSTIGLISLVRALSLGFGNTSQCSTKSTLDITIVISDLTCNLSLIHRERTTYFTSLGDWSGQPFVCAFIASYEVCPQLLLVSSLSNGAATLLCYVVA